MWHDEYRIWNSTFPWSCINELLFPTSASRFWIPDLVLYDSNNFFFMRFESYLVPPVLLMRSDGTSATFPGGDLSLNCKFDLTYFPFDRQNCVIRTGSWSADIHKQRILLLNGGITIQNFTDHEQWTIETTSAESKPMHYSVNSLYSEVHIWIQLRRKSAYYMLNAFVPSLIISAVTGVTFLVPPDIDNRLTLSFTALLAHSMFNSMISNEMPKSAENPPLLLIYLFLMSIFIFVAISLQAFAVYLARSDPWKMPSIFVRLLNFNENDKTIIEKRYRMRKLTSAAYFLDRISFFTYLTLVSTTPVVCFVLIPNLNASGNSNADSINN